MGAPDVGPQEFVGPDVFIPLVPLPGPVDVGRRILTGLRRPDFARARRVSVGWVMATVFTLVFSQTTFATGLAPVVMALALVMAGYTVLRVALLVFVERRQRVFEASWLDGQSRILRSHPFDVVRFRIRASSDQSSTVCRIFDLTSADDMDQLLRQQAVERQGYSQGHADSRAQIEFTYWASGIGSPVLESVRRPLREIEFQPIRNAARRARVQFPAAIYGSRPDRLTYWFLAGPVQVTSGVR